MVILPIETEFLFQSFILMEERSMLKKSMVILFGMLILNYVTQTVVKMIGLTMMMITFLYGDALKINKDIDLLQHDNIIILMIQILLGFYHRRILSLPRPQISNKFSDKAASLRLVNLFKQPPLFLV